jgi:hypothetical protein
VNADSNPRTGMCQCPHAGLEEVQGPPFDGVPRPRFVGAAAIGTSTSTAQSRPGRLALSSVNGRPQRHVSLGTCKLKIVCRSPVPGVAIAMA